MATRYELSGERFGRLLVKSKDKTDARGEIWWLCNCDCGAVKAVRGHKLRSGVTQSCGCLSREITSSRSRTHGMTDTRIYTIWTGMLQRTSNSRNHDFKKYGARGIKVCEEWRAFEKFNDWAKTSGYLDHLTIDRIDCDGDYEPKNCRWVSIADQQRNRRNNKLSAADIASIRSSSSHYSEIARRFGISASYAWSIKNRERNGI